MDSNDDSVTRAEKPLSESLVDACRDLGISRDDFSKLAVKKMGDGSSMRHCFDFCLDEIDDVKGRTAREHGVGRYQVICRDDKCIRKRITFEIKPEELPGRLSVVKSDEGGRRQDDEERAPQPGRRRSRHRNRGGGRGKGAKHNAENYRNASAKNGGSHGADIGFRDLIDAEQRGYDKCKDVYEMVIKQMEIHHAKEVQMVKDSKGSEQFLNDDGGDGGEDGALDRVESIVESIKEAGAPLIDAYAYSMQCKADIAKAEAGVPVEESTAQSAPPSLEDRLRGAFAALMRGATSGEDVAFHINGILRSFTPDEIRANLTANGAVDQLISLYPNLAEHKEWFESVVSGVNSALDKAEKVEAEAGAEKDNGNSGEKK